MSHIEDIWKHPEQFKIATIDGVATVFCGYTYNGVGLHQQRDNDWTVTHLNTGHSIMNINTRSRAKAFEIATKLAEVGDWGFIGKQGYKNMDPEIPAKCKSILMANDECYVAMHTGDDSEDQAREISNARN